MVTIKMIIFLTLTLICGVGVFIGFNLKKWSSWVYGLCGFISGLLIGSLRTDIRGSLELGFLFALAVMFGGQMVFWQRKRYTQQAGTWLLQHGEDKHYSILTRIIKRLLNK